MAPLRGGCSRQRLGQKPDMDWRAVTVEKGRPELTAALPGESTSSGRRHRSWLEAAGASARPNEPRGLDCAAAEGSAFLPGGLRREMSAHLGSYGQHMAHLVDPTTVTAVLLPTGWEEIVDGSFFIDSYEVDTGDPTHWSGGPGFQFTPRGKGALRITGPMSSVLALRHSA